MIKYIGSKRVLLPAIMQEIDACAAGGTVLDLFSGTSRVGHALKGRGWRVLSNDHNAYAHVLARCYVQADRADVVERATEIIDELNALPGEPGWFTRTFAQEGRFFQPHNAARIDAIRDAIAEMETDDDLEAVLLVSLMEAADRVDSTTGVQMAFLKSWATRSYKDLQLRLPDVLDRTTSEPCRAHGLDALEAAARLDADVAYIDPPYNQHSYLGNYHVWESLVRWDRPEVYGIARKRIDCRERRSEFNSKVRFERALRAIIDTVRARHLVVSFNDEGYIARDDMIAMLGTRGPVRVVEHDHARYVGARIGIHDRKGRRVGKIGRLRNREYIFVVSPAVPPQASTSTASALTGDEAAAPDH